MNCNWNQSISLISYDVTIDDDGFEKITEKKRKNIPANFKSVTRKEEEHSNLLGYNADLIIEILSANFLNEETLIDESTNKRYAIKRIFYKTSELIELTVSDTTKRQVNG